MRPTTAGGHGCRSVGRRSRRRRCAGCGVYAIVAVLVDLDGPGEAFGVDLRANLWALGRGVEWAGSGRSTLQGVFVAVEPVGRAARLTGSSTPHLEGDQP